MVDRVKRRYDSGRRDRQANENRERIVRTAHDLFVAHGYVRTTIADVAREAGVSAETVYKGFGNKATLLEHAWFLMFRGDATGVPLFDRPEMQAILAIADPGERLDAHARFVTANNRRSMPLLRAVEGAAASEPGAAKLLTTWRARRIDVASRVAQSAAATGQLTIPEAECRDILYATMDGALWQRLVAERGWTDHRYAAWLATCWRRQFTET